MVGSEGNNTSSPAVLAVSSLVLLMLSAAFLLWRKVGGGQAAPPTKDGSKPLQREENGHHAVEPSKRMSVLFGTQTGTAEGFAKVLAEEARARYGKQVAVDALDLDDYAEDDSEYETKFQSEALAVFLLATYGDGEPTDNAVRFCKWLQAKSEAQEDGSAFLPHLSYAVFGLGNRQYEHFNKVGISTDEQLALLGAQRLVEVGKGDDDQCIEDDFDQWKEALWPELDRLLQDAGAVAVGEHDYEAAIPAYRVVYGGEALSPAAPALTHSAGRRTPALDRLSLRAPVAVRRELHSALSDRSCVHVELDIADLGLSYEAGDHVAIFPENLEDVVATAAARLGVALDTVFSLHRDGAVDSGGSPADSILPEPFPGPCTLRTALARHVDLLSSPKKAALLALAAHAEDTLEQERLHYLASSAGKAEYQEWVVDAHRSLLEVMAAFPSVRPPLGVFFAAIAPPLQPRFYSISSSPRYAGSRIHVTCAVVEETTLGGRLHRGVCSTWLQQSVPAGEAAAGFTSAPLFLRPSAFRLPPDPLLPIVMVGPGTGVAPFRGFLQERLAMLREGTPLGPAMLFFGCRDRRKDYIYEEELENFVKEGALSTLHVAFSREGPSKKYVQHELQAQAGVVWKLLANGGYFYVCGDAKAMARDVHRTLHTIVQQQECVSSSGAEAIVKKLQTEGRYMRDVW